METVKILHRSHQWLQFLEVIKAEDKVSRKKIMRLLKKDRLKASKKAIVIDGIVYVPDDYIRQMIKAVKGE